MNYGICKRRSYISKLSYLSVKQVKLLEDFKLLLTFENGEAKIFDMNLYLEKGIFKELKIFHYLIY